MSDVRASPTRSAIGAASQTPMTTDPKLSHEELTLLYQVTVSDLTYFKTQQWSLTKYTMALLAALVVAAQFLRPSLLVGERLVLVALAVVVAAGAMSVLFKLQESISVRSTRLDSIREGFGSEFNRAWAAEVKGREYVYAFHFLCAVIAVGTAVVCWLVLRA